MGQPSLATGPRSCTHCRATFRTAFERCPNDGALLAVLDHDPLEGTTLGPYSIGQCIGEGAMGRIYRARHARLTGREVALKVLFGDVASTEGMQQRFAHEAEATSRLSHPHIVSVVDFGETPEGLLYLAMELVAGRPLSEVIAEGPLPWPRAIAIARQIGLGLAHAHAHGLVHRDLKPDNVLVGDGDVVWIVDFGLALCVDPVVDRTRLTSGGMVVGTPAYSAPEQQLGNGVVDSRADLFSLGVTLFELLAGVPPFEGTAMEVICQNAMADRPAIARRAPVTVPAALEAIVQRLIRAEAAQRFASATEVIAALDALAAPPRHRGWVIAATALPLIALGIAALAWPRADDREPPPAAQPVEAPVHDELATAAPDSPGGADARSDVPAPSPTDSRRSLRPDANRRTETKRIDGSKMPSRTDDTAHADDKMPLPPRRAAHANDSKMPIPPSHTDDSKMKIPRPTAHAGDKMPLPPGRADDSKMATPTGRTDNSKMPIPPSRTDNSKMARPTGRVDAPPMSPRVDPPVAPVHIDLANLTVHGALTAAAVEQALERANGDLHACYRTVPRSSRSPTTISVRLVIDEAGHATGVDARGDSLLAVCVAAAFSNMRSTAAPDVGTVAVTFDVVFAVAR